MTHLMRSLAPVALAAAIVITVAGCSAPPGHSGTTADPVTLVAVWGNGPGGIGADVLDALAHPEEDSPVTVADPLSAADIDPADEEGAALAALASGDADLSVIRSDRLVTAGARSLAPLAAPLIVTNNAQAQAIAADPVAEDLMAGLADIGLVGIALAPGGVRHPFGYAAPLLGPDDYAGTTINTRVGDGVDAIAAALGATPDHSVGSDRSAAVKDGRLDGIEVSLQQFQAVDRPAVLTANVVLYEKFDVVVMRAGAYDSLSAAQQDELRARVAGAIATATAARDDEPAGFAQWCASSGASAVLASDDQLARLATALTPVVTTLQADPDTAAVIERMRALHDGTTDQLNGTCDDPTAGTTDADFLVTPDGDQTVLDGTWRVEVTVDELKAAGSDFHDAQANAGVWTFTTSNGSTIIDQPSGPDCEGTFAFAGNQISLNWMANGNDHCFGQSKGTYVLDGDTARITWKSQRDYDVALDNALFAKGLVKVQ